MRNTFAALLTLTLPISQIGCNALGHVRAGGLVTPMREATYGGGEVGADIYGDMRAGDHWIEGKPQPERASRAGVVSGAYMRMSGAGFGLGVRPGIFGGSTDDKYAILAAAGASLGLQTWSGTTYGSVGLYGRLLVGFPVKKTYDPRAWKLCRSLSFVTVGVEGLVDRVPSAHRTFPSIGLFVGMLGLEDGGAPSDRKVKGANCPR